LTRITIAIDAMGGDHGPSVIVPAALQALVVHHHLQLILVGDSTILQTELEKHGAVVGDRLTIQHASQRVEMDESPAIALRSKKDSSMRVAINLVKEGLASACVSAGNTGALMATARFVLKTIPGIDRPAIISSFPTHIPQRKMRMLDLGANVDSSAEHLFQFAVMGSVFVSALDNISMPKVCLLNIGEEDIKGNEQVKQTAQLLAHTDKINYAGYIEGDQIYTGHADVIVCDGFVGNVALKTTEGVVKFVYALLKEAFKRTKWTRLIGLFARPILKSVGTRINPDLYNGACLIGLRGIVIKSHGSASTVAFANAITEAVMQVQKNIPQLIGSEVEQLLKRSSGSSD
jgi:phosphate acyltransferase